MTRDEHFMSLALEEARFAAQLGEIPVGAALVRGDTVLARTHNLRETEKHALAHAEILAIDAGCRALGGWRLPNCELFVTLEPCPMCAGAIINSRIARLVFGAYDPKAGCAGSVCDLFSMSFNHRPDVLGGVLRAESADMLRAFFKNLRENS